MVRISKLTDYGMVIMAFMAKEPSRLFQAREIAAETEITYPTVSKLLKKLSKNKFLSSNRGIQGGYQLAISPKDISVADLVQALEGPIAITECNLGHDHCVSETNCGIRAPWLRINAVITNALSSIRLSDLVTSSAFGVKHVITVRS